MSGDVDVSLDRPSELLLIFLEAVRAWANSEKQDGTSDRCLYALRLWLESVCVGGGSSG